MSLFDGTRAGIHASVHLFTLSNMNISVTSGPIAIKVYLQDYLGEGKAGFRGNI